MYSVDSSCGKLRYKPVVLDRVMEALAVLTQLSGWTVAAFIYTENGNIDKDTIIGLIVSLLLFFMFLTSSYAPADKIHFQVRINRHNIARQYTFALMLIRFINIFVGILFSVGILSQMYSWAAIAKSVIMVVMFLGILVYYIVAFMNR